MRKWAVILTSFILVLSFQNCQQSQLPIENHSSQPTITATEFQKSSASGLPVLQLWDYELGKTIDVDVSTGKMAVYLNYGGDRGQDRCLSEPERQHLQALLRSSEICKPVIPPEAFLDQVCTQLYRYPYAVLVDKGIEVRLGEKTNGCDVATDLCGAQSQALQAFVQGVLRTLEQKSCQ